MKDYSWGIRDIHTSKKVLHHFGYTSSGTFTYKWNRDPQKQHFSSFYCSWKPHIAWCLCGSLFHLYVKVPQIVEPRWCKTFFDVCIMDRNTSLSSSGNITLSDMLTLFPRLKGDKFAWDINYNLLIKLCQNSENISKGLGLQSYTKEYTIPRNCSPTFF